MIRLGVSRYTSGSHCCACFIGLSMQKSFCTRLFVRLNGAPPLTLTLVDCLLKIFLPACWNTVSGFSYSPSHDDKFVAWLACLVGKTSLPWRLRYSLGMSKILQWTGIFDEIFRRPFFSFRVNCCPFLSICPYSCLSRPYLYYCECNVM